MLLLVCDLFYFKIVTELTTTGLATQSMAKPAASTYASSPPVGGSGAMPASCNLRSKRARL